MRLLVFSDIHGDRAALERAMKTEADFYIAAGDLANWGRGLDQLGPILATRAGRTYVIPGNHESESDVSAFCARFGLEDLHGRSVTLDGHNIAALGYSNPTPFQTPGEYSEEEIAARLKPFQKVQPTVLICHCPPKGTRLDRAGEGKHFGSTAVRDFIEKTQPPYFYCGHIHEAAGVREVLGRTEAWNVGKKGVLLELPSNSH